MDANFNIALNFVHFQGYFKQLFNFFAFQITSKFHFVLSNINIL